MIAPEPRERPTDDTSSSGERRIERPALPSDDVLPPTPPVLTERPRISTGRYAIISPISPGVRREKK